MTCPGEDLIQGEERDGMAWVQVVYIESIGEQNIEI